MRLLLLLTLIMSPLTIAAYQTPPAELQAIVDAPRGPLFRLGPKHGTALLLSLPGLPGISDVAQPELKLAGLRINPRMSSQSRFDFANGASLLDIKTGLSRSISGLPKEARIADTAWSANERWIAFSRWGDTGVELWLIDVAQASAKPLIKAPINAIAGAGFSWLSASEQLLVQLKPAGTAPTAALTPSGPNTQDSQPGAKSSIRTYADMLKTPADADLLDWHLQSQLATVNLKGEIKKIAQPLTLLAASSSPDGELILTTSLRRPYSYLLPVSYFPQAVEVWNKQGKLLKTIALPLQDRIPPGNDAVSKEPRDFAWRKDLPATLTWLEAQDGGNPATEAKIRDALFQQSAPFTAPPQKLIELAWRASSLHWGSGDLAMVEESWWKTRDTRTWLIRPDHPEQAPELLTARKSEDRYADPGEPVLAKNAYGQNILKSDGKAIYLIGEGAGPEGDRPFLDRYELASKKSKRLWQSQAPFYEIPVAMLGEQQIISSREANTERPNFYLRDLAGDAKPRALTQFPHPTPQLKDVQKQKIQYTRKDGVMLDATLYLPAGYKAKRDGPLPMLMWAYPREFKNAQLASQVRESPYRFNRISYNGPQAMLARGYAVLDNPAMPIVGEGKTEPNDNYLPQLTMNAEAAVDAVVKLGVADRNKIAVGGHSYGAFMTANLLAHTRLFKAGIARSGAYNRTLTPFGFQSEDRNFWEAKPVYQAMAPFNFSDQIKDPLLLIHGEMDNNSGTFPVQSERMYQALQGLGARARLVMLPNESHGYRARESIMQMLWEQDQWLETYLKAKP
ncbi:alpha/beta hydrolase family protein [Janthinobacterium sp. B9-8]|uniref:alpha/beta hydrolase family protein n=1 Tax=Janthinobacterium sp. B9-8 TaxID=1236179 RepID=UPI00061D13E7|nr:prolyl oligopeptidase family serine peptidase [Janthinobacterium sp. B9-8]AMC36451.1 aminoacyl peptidase [Janthinobacterium sp. B9-8]